MKTCACCKKTKELADFCNNRSSADGKAAYCRQCSSEKSRKRYYSNIEQERKRAREYARKRFAKRTRAEALAHKERMKAFYASKKDDPEYRRKNAERASLWNKANPGKTVARIKAWRLKNRERHLSQGRVKEAKRRAKLAVSPSNFSSQDVLDLLVAQTGRCIYCLTDISNLYHIDHIVPVSKGGSNDRSNIQLLCPTCNLQKGTRSHEDSLREKNVAS